MKMHQPSAPESQDMKIEDAVAASCKVKSKRLRRFKIKIKNWQQTRKKKTEESGVSNVIMLGASMNSPTQESCRHGSPKA